MVLGVPILWHFRVVWLGEHAKICHASSNTEKAFIQKCTSVALNLVKIDSKTSHGCCSLQILVNDILETKFG